VFNANYVAYFDVVMTEMWREAVVPYQEMVDSGTDMVVAEINVRFLGSARFDEELDFEVRVTRLGETSMSTRIDGTSNGKTVAEGQMRHVFIDVPTKAKCPIPADIRSALEPFLVADRA
jgi:acyl-CoA thioester hydrolase